ncbi:MAG: hypothetical protein ACE5HC_10195 [Candidatus Binatia bacterium]
MIRYVRSGDLLLAVHVSGDWEEGLKFYSQDQDFVQVGTWCYSEGMVLKAHRHNPVERVITHTQEVVYVRKGALRATVYDLDGRVAGEIEASQGDFIIMLNGGHGYRVLENETQVLEIKNGPYPGADLDRTRL